MQQQKTFAFIVMLFLFTGLYAQNTEFSLNSPITGFVYNGKPVSPEAILPFLPGMELRDTIRPKTVNLKEVGINSSVIIDTIAQPSSANPTVFYRVRNEYGGEISYVIAAALSENRYVLKVYENGGGTLTFPYVFVLKVVGDTLVKIGYFNAEPLYKNKKFTVIVKGNIIINGSIRYRIPD